MENPLYWSKLYFSGQNLAKFRPKKNTGSMMSLSSFKAFCFCFELAFVDSPLKKRKRESRVIFCMNFCHFMTKPKKREKVQLIQSIFLGKKWDKVALPKYCRIL
jgi:hypothetical protein